jgi:hypothetical protein
MNDEAGDGVDIGDGDDGAAQGHDNGIPQSKSSISPFRVKSSAASSGDENQRSSYGSWSQRRRFYSSSNYGRWPK